MCHVVVHAYATYPGYGHSQPYQAAVWLHDQGSLQLECKLDCMLKG